ncbi:MAG TPA: AAA family ATPase [Gaiellaceae bacterium]|nr:AAA family ATPase [Gaiellaceae bacterium]
MSTLDQARSAVELLEREDALAVLHGAHSEARAGTGRLVLVSGEAGIGKTSLVRAFTASIDRSGRVLEGACDALFAPRPLGPFADIAATTNGRLRELLELGAGSGEVFEVLREELSVGRAVLVLEDLHWADEASLDVLRMLGRRLGSTPALVIGTYRDDELDRVHPLRMVLGELSSQPVAESIHLEALSAEAVTHLALGHDVDAAELRRVTGGNPFYVREVLEVGGNAIPTTVRDAVLARMARLSPEATEIVYAVALAPPELDAWSLQRVCGSIDRFDEALAAGVLVAKSDNVAFRHELARTTIEETIGPARRVELHRRLLAALAEPASGAPDLARLAHHAEGARDADAALRFAFQAAESAASVGAYREAAAQYARALRFADGRPPGERAALLEGRSRACYLADDQLEAIAVIQEAIACHRRAGTSEQEAVALAELVDYLTCRGLFAEAEEAVAEATRLIEGSTESSATARVLHARSILIYDSNLDASIGLAREAETIAARHGDLETAAEARITAATLESRRDAAVGRQILEAVAEDASERGLTLQAARALNNLGMLGIARYDHELANQSLSEAFEYCVDHNLDLWRINVVANWARSQLDQGRWTEAAELATQVLEDPRESPWPQCEALRVLALVRARRGDPGAREALDRTSTVGLSPEEVSAVVDLAAAGAEVAWLASGDVEAETATALEEARGRRAADDVARLSFWRRLAGLDAPDSTETWRESAEEWSHRGCPYETALALFAEGNEAALMRALAICQELGARPLATRVTRRLRQLGANGVPRGPRPSTRGNPANLTARELDVLELVSEGLRNAEIADRLVVSKRTVDHHVSAILRKLDARTRGEASATAQRLGISRS